MDVDDKKINAMNAPANVLTYLEITCRRFGNRTALRMGNHCMTFSELLRESRSIGAMIASKNIRNQPIVVLADRTIHTPVLFLGVLYSGNYYVPIDPSMPASKMRAIMDDLSCPLVLASHQAKVRKEAIGNSAMILAYDSISHSGSNCYPIPPGGDSPLFVVYTSGTTGAPKGIVKSHHAEISFIESYCRTFNFSEHDIIGNQTPFFFDASSKDLYLMIKTGATMDIIPHELFMAPIDLITYLNEHQVSFISWVPTALIIVSRLNTFAVVKPTTLRKVFFVGEVMPVVHLKKWMDALPDVEFVNLYGFSEIAGIACFQTITNTTQNSGRLPIGKPLDNCRVYLVSEGRTISESGKVGELYIASEALALEYVHDPELTQRCFVDFTDENCAPSRCYRTGDLAEYDQNGNLLFVSRCDFQIKHMGHRIELGEIEYAAEHLENIQRACCIYQQKETLIHLFCELTPGSIMSKRDILKALGKVLSPYMIPGKIDILPSLPINSNGKIDRQLLATKSPKSH